jgi:hypothetical protein
MRIITCLSRLASIPKSLLLIIGCSVLVVVLGSSASASESKSQSSEKPLAFASLVQKYSPEKVTGTNYRLATTQIVSKQAPPAADKAVATVQSTPSTNNSTTTSPTTTTPVVKYKTSPDPLSDAYSTTPPNPGPTDIDIPITENNQVPVGTVINYSSVKDETVYYGGDLVLDSPSISVHLLTSQWSTPFIISTPDGSMAGVPVEPWNDQSNAACVGSQIGSNPGSNWTIAFLFYTDVAPGTYTIHLQSIRDVSGTVSYEYDLFVTVNVYSQ